MYAQSLIFLLINSQFLLEILGVNEFLPNNAFMKFISKWVCETEEKFLCEDTMFLLCGADKAQLNQVTEESYLLLRSNTERVPIFTNFKILPVSHNQRICCSHVIYRVFEKISGKNVKSGETNRNKQI